jgi:hypothetical protein
VDFPSLPSVARTLEIHPVADTRIVWVLRPGEELLVFDMAKGTVTTSTLVTGTALGSLAMAPSAACAVDANGNVLDASSARPLYQLGVDRSSISSSVHHDPIANCLLCGGGFGESLNRWNLRTGRVTPFSSKAPPGRPVAFRGDRSVSLGESSIRVSRLIDDEWQIEHDFAISADGTSASVTPESLAVRSNGREIAWADPREVHLASLDPPYARTKADRRDAEGTGPCRTMWIDDGHFLVADHEGRVELWSSSPLRCDDHARHAAFAGSQGIFAKSSVLCCTTPSTGSLLMALQSGVLAMRPDGAAVVLKAPVLDAIAISTSAMLLLLPGELVAIQDSTIARRSAIAITSERLVALLDSGRRVAVYRGDGSLALHDVATLSLIAEMAADRDSNGVVVLPDGHYMADPGATDLLGFRRGLDGFGPAQFDVLRNRPDLVLATLGVEEPGAVDAAKDIVERRLRRLGLTGTPGDLASSQPAKVLFVEVPAAEVDQPQLSLRVRAAPGTSALASVQCFVNGAAAFPDDGVPWSPAEDSLLMQLPPVRLARGANRIEVVIQDRTGLVSMPARCTTHLLGATTPTTLHFLGIGVGRTGTARRDLDFPAKDVADLFEVLRQGNRHVRGTILTDEGATRDPILAALAALRDLPPEDRLVLHFAGHGLRDGSRNFWFAAHGVDFATPTVRGVSYRDVEQALQACPCQQKLLLLDTCDAGDTETGVGAATTRPIASESRDGTTIRVRGIDPLESQQPASRNRIDEMFREFRRGTGTTVFVAAPAGEFAYESRDVANGLFTRAILDAIENQRAPDHRVTLRDLPRDVIRRVTAWTRGHQSPVLRRAGPAEFELHRLRSPVPTTRAIDESLFQGRSWYNAINLAHEVGDRP